MGPPVRRLQKIGNTATAFPCVVVCVTRGFIFQPMKKWMFLLLLAVCLPVGSGCRRAVSYRGPEVENPRVRTFASHPAGSDLRALLDDFELAGLEFRERSGLPENQKSMVYFLKEGNLHIEAARDADGDWLLTSVPYLEPSDIPPADRISKWDAAVELDHPPSPGEKHSSVS